MDPDGGCESCPKNGKVGDTFKTNGAVYTNLADGGWTRQGLALNEVVVRGKYTTGSDFNNWGANFMIATKMTRDWAFGMGDETRNFDNDRVANALRNADVVNQARDYWYAKVNKSGNTVYDGVTNFKGKQRLGGGNFGLVGLAKAGVDPIEQFVGSFTPEISSNGIDLTFTIKNTSSFKSLMYGIAPEWSRATLQPGGNMYQVYTFREPIMFNKIRRFN
ncbi:hypothetical protein [Pedobacter alpinus]|uniref:TonB-dependent receptor-like beta-barrel domain-containing protein n=1 Tax=Pedobacter alpinus TaxID=1590643 RepID=A0ABW5TVS6_9SPHI